MCVLIISLTCFVCPFAKPVDKAIQSTSGREGYCINWHVEGFGTRQCAYPMSGLIVCGHDIYSSHGCQYFGLDHSLVANFSRVVVVYLKKACRGNYSDVSPPSLGQGVLNRRIDHHVNCSIVGKEGLPLFDRTNMGVNSSDINNF